MATINYVIFDHHRSAEGDTTVKIRLTHKGKQAYHATIFRVAPSQLKKDNTIKDPVLLRKVNKYIDQLWERMEGLSRHIEGMTAKEVLRNITQPEKVVEIDFIKFCKSHLDELEANGKSGTLRALKSPYNQLVDFTGGSLDARDISTMFLKEFERHLTKPRIVTRAKAGGGQVTMKLKPMDRSGVFKVMANVRILFNHCRKYHNSRGSI